MSPSAGWSPASVSYTHLRAHETDTSLFVGRRQMCIRDRFGGVVPDAITALIKLIATLHDAEGNVTVGGLESGVAPDLHYPEERLREESGLLDGVELIGKGSILTRMWAKPSITTIGIDAPSVATSSNTLVPQAVAKISMRIAPN